MARGFWDWVLGKPASPPTPKWCTGAHDVEGQPIHPVGSSTYVNERDELGNGICYRMRICKKCGKRVAVTAQDAQWQAASDADVNRVMNASRATLGLPPIDFSL